MRSKNHEECAFASHEEVIFCVILIYQLTVLDVVIQYRKSKKKNTSVMLLFITIGKGWDFCINEVVINYEVNY